MRRKIRQAKAQWEHKAQNKAESFVKRLCRQWRVQERIAAANKWAEGHPRRTAAMTIGALTGSLLFGILISIYMPQPSSDIVGDIENVQSMFTGLRSIQSGKDLHMSEVGQLALQGQRLKYELDSLVRIPVKTHLDSTLIIRKYRQLEMIVENLKHQ